MSQQGSNNKNGGSGGVSVNAIQVDAFTPPGTNPVVPDATNKITVTGGQVAAGTTTNVIRTDSLSANTFTIEVQRSQAVGSSTVGDNGVSHFNSAQFTVDSNGFVSLAGGSAAETLTGNSGGAVSPASNNIFTVGTGSITIVGNPGTNTLTTELTGLTNHSLLVGAGTPTITSLGVASNGQLPIGSAGADPVLATLTAGTGINISNGAGSITISSSTGGMAWSNKSTNFNAVAENGYFIVGSCVATLPASPNIGDTIEFAVQGAFTLTIQANTGQTIQMATNVSSSAGTQVNTMSGDSCRLVYNSTGTNWFAASFVGGWNKT